MFGRGGSRCWFQIFSNIFFSTLLGEDLHFEYIIFFNWVVLVKKFLFCIFLHK